jgi:hypothetical protein
MNRFTAIDSIPIALGIFVVAVVWLLIVDSLDARRIKRCLLVIGSSQCPRCKENLGDATVSTAKQRMLKFTSGGRRRLRGRDYPSRLITVVCPNCSAELDFRLDGGLFSCNHEIFPEPRPQKSLVP